jgi:hypothetical protein
MTTGQTMLAVGALVLLTTIMLNFYRVFSHQWVTIEETQIGIDATTVATSLFEFAHGLAFDQSSPVSSVNELTDPVNFGPDPDPLGETDVEIIEWNNPTGNIYVFDDFDDLHGYEIEIDAGYGHVYRAEFEVYYIEPSDVTQKSISKTYTKRMDLSIWRETPPPPTGADIDTVRMWTVMGYFTFQ